MIENILSILAAQTKKLMQSGPKPAAPIRTKLQFETLEGRDVPSVGIQQPEIADLTTPLAVQRAYIQTHPAAAQPPATREADARAAVSGGWFGVDPARDGVYAKPHRYVGTIYTFWKDGRINQATGFIVGRQHVLTAGHVLYDITKKESPVTVMFTAAEYFGKAPVGSANGAKWGVAREFLNGNKYYDFAVIKLNRPLGDRTLGWFAMKDWDRGANYNVQIAGYSYSFGEAKSMLRGTTRTEMPLRYPELRWKSGSLSPMGGLSGSPLIVNEVGKWKVVGIYTTGDAFGIGGVKLTKEVRTRLQTWINNNPSGDEPIIPAPLSPLNHRVVTVPVVPPQLDSPPINAPVIPSRLENGRAYSFASANFLDRAIRHRNFEAWLDQRDTSDLFARDSGFIARPGLADPSLVSFESVNFPGRFLRHREMLLHLDANNGSDLYKLDATFRVVTGLNGTGVSFESVNFPGHFIRHEHFRLKIAANNGSELFRNDATFSATATILPVTYAPSTSAPTPPSVVTPPPSPAVTVRVPAPPATPVAANVWARAVDLNWGRVTNADWVKVFRSADGVNFAEVGAVRGDQTRFRVEGLRPGTIYWFRLQAVNQFGNSPFSDTVNLKTKREAPIAPSGLVAANVWATRVDLAWADRSDNESGFVVQLSTDGKIFREVGRTGANTTHFRVEQLRPNTRYWFRVLAVNEIEASVSTELMVTTKR